MSILLNLRDIDLSYGTQVLLDKANLIIHNKEIISLIGRNGEGKSTLLKLIAQIIEPDNGEYEKANTATIAYLPQSTPDNMSGDVFSIVASGLADLAKHVIHYHQISQKISLDSNEKNLSLLASAQQRMETHNGWGLQQRVSTVLSQLNLDGKWAFNDLSGGIKRRVLLGRELVKNPNLLLLDEPTNHLDIKSVVWLENLIKTLPCSVLLITHDRTFMQHVSQKILELDRGHLTMWDSDYQNYLRRKSERENAIAKENRRFDKKLSQEEDWIRQGIKARRTRNEGRVRKLVQMREQLQQRRHAQGKVNLKLQAFEKSGKLVIEATHIHKKFAEKTIIKDFNFTMMRGDKIGIIGGNGTGKTTLVNILLDNLKPDEGFVKIGSNLEVAYFDQLHSTLALDKSVRDNISGGSDNVIINGKIRHVNSYLKDFLFKPEQTASPVSTLSGGERNRLMLAKMFAKPANFLILDEPTNDLDIETLDLLEELLSDYQGSVLIVSHDRQFLDHVVDGSIIFETNGQIYQNIGGYSDWMAVRDSFIPPEKPSIKKHTKIDKPSRSKSATNQLKKITEQIETLEVFIGQLQKQLSKDGLYQNEREKFNTLTLKLSANEKKLTELYDKWQELEIAL